jgi:hypothetical protein
MRISGIFLDTGQPYWDINGIYEFFDPIWEPPP